MSWISASASNYVCNLQRVKAVRVAVCLSTACSHTLMRQPNKTEQAGIQTDLFINSRKKLRAIDFYCDQLRPKGYPPYHPVACAEHVWKRL